MARASTIETLQSHQFIPTPDIISGNTPTVYTPDMIIPGVRENGVDSQVLAVTFNHRKHVLPVREVAPGVRIVWLDTNPEVNLERAADASEDMARLLMWYHTNVEPIRAIVTPNSKKSTWFIERAARTFQENLGLDVPFMILQGGKNYLEVAKNAYGKPIPYYPVTSQTEPKYTAITRDQAKILKEFKGKGIVVLDDVYSTGETLIAVDAVLRRALRIQRHVTFPKLVLAKEEVVDKNYPRQLPHHVSALMYLPEMVEQVK